MVYQACSSKTLDYTTINKKLSYRRVTASCQLKSCQLSRNSAETTCTTSPEQIDVMKLKRYAVRQCVVNMCTPPWRDRVALIVLYVS